jgi:hypothetical protein
MHRKQSENVMVRRKQQSTLNIISKNKFSLMSISEETDKQDEDSVGNTSSHNSGENSEGNEPCFGKTVNRKSTVRPEGQNATYENAPSKTNLADECRI